MENLNMPADYYGRLAANINETQVAPLQKILSDLEPFQDDEYIKGAASLIKASLSKATGEYIMARNMWLSKLES